MASKQPPKVSQMAGDNKKPSPWNPFERGQKLADHKTYESSGDAAAAKDSQATRNNGDKPSYYALPAPEIKAPAGGGALKSIDDKFQVNSVSGTCSLSIPFAISPGRSGLTPDVTIGYDSGNGNGPFGLGWQISIPAISRKTSKGLPRYRDDINSDVFLLTGLEDLVPKMTDGKFVETGRGGWSVREYWPRTEGGFTRIERWSKPGNPADAYWRMISKSNVVSLFGQTANSKILDPATGRVFSWYLCATYDARGNATKYTYKEEDSVGVRMDEAHEGHRSDASRSVNRYIKSIKYGNIKSNRDENWDPQAVDDDGWMFEVIFDYGDHTGDNPTTKPDALWQVRQDPYSTYNSGFEVRTYRLCQRFLLFHHFPAKEELGVQDYLVKSMDLSYRKSETASVLISVTQSGHAMDPSSGSKVKRSLPPMTFDYSQVDLTTASIQSVPSSALANLPTGLSTPFQWVDLDGIGKPSALYANDAGWFCMRNLSSYQPNYHDASAGIGEVLFGPAEPLKQAPRTGSEGKPRFIDVDGNGRLDLVRSELGQQGFYERTDEGGWTEFKRFSSWPTDTEGEENFRYLDLTGNGFADIVIAEVDTFLWYPELGTEGYGEGTRVFTGAAEDDGPRLLFTDGVETIYLADFSGDGLIDLVRIRNGDVCYWPNIGYGQFGAKVTMDNAPWMDPRNRYNHGRILLTDVDGSGAADILYFPPEGGLRVYFNQAGNSWSAAVEVDFPTMDTLSEINAFDLFGLGLPSLVWSTELPASGRLSMQYLDFTHGLKPYLMMGYKNGPVETRVEYASSVKYHQADELYGRPWPTRLSFPVHCVSQSATYDYLSRSYHVSQYAYHDGYYDGLEREFRGFGKVETTTSEYFLLERSSLTFPSSTDLQGLTSPPTLHVAWFHTGAYEESGKVQSLHQTEYYSASGLPDIPVSNKDPVLSSGMSAMEVRQAYRALKGSPLHEGFLLDGSGKEHIPFTINDNSDSVKMLQPAKGVQPGVFLVSPRESIVCQVERNPADPRVKHEITLETDSFGNIIKSVVVNYGRKSSSRTPAHSEDDWKAQGTNVITYTEHDLTNPVSSPDEYHTPETAEVRAYQVTGLSPKATYFAFDEISPDKLRGLPTKVYTDESDAPGLKLLSRVQTRYRANDLSKILDPFKLESMEIIGETYILAVTPDIVHTAYQSRGAQPLLSDLSVMEDKGQDGGGYVDLEHNKSYWVPSGLQTMSLDENVTSEQELSTARLSFFQPMRYIDPFGHWQTIKYDKYFLHPLSITDALGNTVSAEIDYRTLQPRLVTDANGNQAASAFDALGQCVGSAVMGKPTSPLGDTTEQFYSFWDSSALAKVISEPLKFTSSLLANCTSCSFSDSASFSEETGLSPGFNISVGRDKNVADVKAGKGSVQLQVGISYFDGLGRTMQKKALANTDRGKEQWVTDDCAITNNAGGVVRQYDAYFEASHVYARSSGIVSSTTFYDPLGRIVAIILPNRTWTKEIYSPWSQTTYDPGDTVLVEDPMADPDVGRYFAGLESKTLFRPTWYSNLKPTDPVDCRIIEQCKAYADTTITNWFDARGESFLSITDNGKYGKYVSRGYRDVVGRVKRVIDTEGRLVNVNTYDMMDTCVYSTSMEIGEKWVLNDVTGTQIRSRNSRGIQQRLCFDKGRRPTASYVRMDDSSSEFLAQTFSYGEDQPEPEAKNLRGKAYQIQDQAVIATIQAYDHLGNAINSTQQLVKEYKKNIDWSSPVDLEDERFTWSTIYDALGREITKTRTDGSAVTNTWSQRGTLASVTYSGKPATEGQVIKDMEYNARGQRVSVTYGNGTQTHFEYDPKTFMLTSKKLRRGNVALQYLQYTMDCVMKIVQIDDLAQQDIFFRGEVVKPTKQFTYDPIGRLIKATGREHLGQTGDNWVSIPSSSAAGSRSSSPSDRKEMAIYTEDYTYSPEGNILSLAHGMVDKTILGWTRTYTYNEPSELEKDKHNNRLSSTSVGNTVSTYQYDGASGKMGLMTSMSGFPVLQYDFHGRLRATSIQTVTISGATPEMTYYRYDSSNQRVRKVTERFAAPGEIPVHSKDHLYVNGAEIEIFRKFNGTGSTVASERWSWHVSADGARAVLVEADKKLDNDSAHWEDVVSRYMVHDHISSVSLELDENGKLISLEEFAPYGSTTYDATANLKVDKRYRYAAKERDSETGLYYFENRYLMPWLGRWLSPDPLGTQDGHNVYCYDGCDPINNVDPSGLNWFVFINVLSKDNKVRFWDGAVYKYTDGDIVDKHSFWEKLQEINKVWWCNGKCELTVMYRDPSKGGKALLRTQNIPQEKHAEETVFDTLNTKQLGVYAMLISLEPCHGGRYPGHDCRNLFVDLCQPKKSEDPNLQRFVPMELVTPIFYLEDQTPKRSSSSTISAMRGSCAIYFLQCNWGIAKPQIGRPNFLNTFGPTLTNEADKWQAVVFGGQEHMEAHQIIGLWQLYKNSNEYDFHLHLPSLRDSRIKYIWSADRVSNGVGEAVAAAGIEVWERIPANQTAYVCKYGIISAAGEWMNMKTAVPATAYAATEMKVAMKD